MPSDPPPSWPDDPRPQERSWALTASASVSAEAEESGFQRRGGLVGLGGVVGEKEEEKKVRAAVKEKEPRRRKVVEGFIVGGGVKLGWEGFWRFGDQFEVLAENNTLFP